MKQTSIAVINLINAARAAPTRKLPSPSALLSSPQPALNTLGRASIMTSFSTASPSTPAGHLSRASNTKGASGLRSISSKSPSPPDQPISLAERLSLSLFGMGRSMEHRFTEIVSFSMLRVALSLGVFGYSRDGSLLSITLVELRPL